MDQTAEANLNHCIHILKNDSSDNEKFSALLMVAKAVKSEQCDAQRRREIYDAIGFTFLKRLIKTGKVPDGCPPYIYKSVALSLLACFRTDKQLAKSEDMLQLIPFFSDTLTSVVDETGSDDVMETSMVTDAYDCLEGILQEERGRFMLIQESTPTKLVGVILKKYYGWERAKAVLNTLMQTCGSSVWRGRHQDFTDIMNHLVEEFRSNETQRKFDVCTELIILLSSLPKNEVEEPPPWLKPLVTTLWNVLQNRLDAEKRNRLLKLSSVIVNSLGISCLLPPLLEDCRLLLLIIHLACIEVRMALEDCNLDEINTRLDLLTACYSLLENTIVYLTNGPLLPLDDKQIVQLHSAMVGAFNAVVFFLSECSSKEDTVNYDASVISAVRVLGSWLAEETSTLKKDIYKILPFIMKVCKSSLENNNVSGKSVEDPTDRSCISSLSKEDRESETVESVCSSNSIPFSSEESMQIDSIDKSHPCRECSSSCTHQSHKFSSDYKFQESLYLKNVDVLRFVLPGLCHLSSEDESRKILISEGTHSCLVEYFKRLLEKFSEKDDLEVKQPLITVCSILLNFVVLEAELVSNHSSFKELLSVVTKLLPTVVYRQDLTVLTANLSTLGLMLLQKQHKTSDVNCDIRIKFLNAVITFLRGRFCTDKGNDGKFSLGISEQYKPYWEDISELWFLSLQVLCVTIPVYPEVVSVIMKSGWIPSLIKLLIQVEDDSNPDCALSIGSLLCILSNDKSAKTVIQEQDGIKFSQMYKLPELEKILSS